MGFFDSSAGGVVSGITGLIGGILQNKANKKAAEKNYQYQLSLQQDQQKADQHLAEYQHQKNLEMWNLENKYNSPQEQIKRYQEAGLNPNLLYGNISSGNSNSIPQYQAPRTDYSGLRSVTQPATDWSFLRNVLTDMMNFKSWQSDQKIKEEQSNNLAVRTANERTKIVLNELGKEIKELERDGLKSKNLWDTDKYVEWQQAKENRQKLLQTQVNTAIHNERVAKRRAHGITDNPHSWAGILNNVVNSYLSENGQGTYSEFVGKWFKGLQNYFERKRGVKTFFNKVFGN